MESGQCAPACFLNAQGKVESYFTLACGGPDLFWLDVECTPGKPQAEKLRSVIDRFTFAEQFGLQEETQFTHGLTRSTHDGFILEGKTLRFSTFGIDSVWGPAAELQAIQKAEANPPLQLEKDRIDRLVPAVGHEITEEASPLEIGLGAAIAPNKGCYPGQEVIERIISIGSPARRLIRIEGQGSPQVGDSLLDGTSVVGQITTVDLGAGTFRALAIVRKTHTKEGIELAIAAKELPPSPHAHGRITAVAATYF
jgi:folate-binding protein YgfZ